MEKKCSNKDVLNKCDFSIFRALVPSCPQALMLSLLLLTLQTFAQITGTVLDADTKTPLKNALVSLKSTGDLTLTNENGTFTLTKTAAGIVNVKQAVPAMPFTLNRNHLQLNITSRNTQVKLSLLNLNGQIIHKTTKTLQPGSHNIDLSGAFSVNSMHILQVTINNIHYTTNLLPSSCSRALVFSCPHTLVPSSTRAFTSSLSLDTLIVSKYLYTPQTTPVTAAISVLLQKPATPPPPPGMKAIPGGTNVRGSARTFSDNDEQPVKEITISPFFMDSTEVTQADFKALLNIQPWAHVVLPGCGNNYPAWKVNWYDAALYCNARSKRDGLDTVYIYDLISGVAGDSCILENVKTDFDKKGYRLPTESEWEYAARGGASTDYYWGNYTKQDLITPMNYAWYGSNAAHPVAMKLPNSYELYDVAGNVYEWVNDYYSPNSYYSEEIVDPKGPNGGDERVVRGGSWLLELFEVRPADRLPYKPAMGFNYVGFRVILPNK